MEEIKEEPKEETGLGTSGTPSGIEEASEEEASSTEIPKEVEEDTIEIGRKDLKFMKEEIAKMKEEQKLLLSIADKKNLSLYYQRNRKDLPQEVKVRTMGDKVIVRWRTVKDEVYKNDVGRLIENQVIELLFNDGSTKELSLLEFNRNYQHILCKQIGSSVDEEGNVALKLQSVGDGKVYSIDVRYVN